MSGHPSSVRTVVAEAAAAVESAFLSASRGLGQGLSAFGSLTESIDALGAELDGGTASTTLDLGRMARTLRAVAEQLPTDGSVLEQVLDGNRTMMRRFDDLIGDMRMVTIVSRSARLEAGASAEQGISLADFSSTIDRHVGDGHRRIAHCMSRHGRLTGLLERSMRAHLAFTEAYGGRLLFLAGELDDGLALIGRRREAGRAFMAEAAARARSIAQAAGMALVSLQVGDNTRQRLEHVLFALAQAEEFASEPDGASRTVATCNLLRSLAEAQLRDTVGTFDAEAASILEAFAVLGRDTESLVTSGRTISGHGGGAGSSMADFRSRLAAAREILAACEANRQVIGHATAELSAMLMELQGTLTTLGMTSDGLVIMAMNVGLKAGRLGAEGRGLVTVAGELKRLVGQITSHTDALLSTFEKVHRDAKHFMQEAGEDVGRATSLDADATAILAALATGDERIAHVLATIDATGQDFEVTLNDAVAAFTGIAGDTIRLTAVAGKITGETIPGRDGEDALAAAVGMVDGLMLPLYSMAQEREVHREIVGTPLLPRESALFEDWTA